MKTRTVRHMDQVVFMDAEGNRHVANVAKVHSNTMINVIYQDQERTHTAASVPHKSGGAGGAYFIHPDEEEK